MAALDFSGLQANVDGVSTSRQLTPTELQEQRQSQKAADDLQRAREVLKIYQDRIKISETREIEIMKGLNERQDLRELFIKAMELIADLTDNAATAISARSKIDKFYR